LKTSKDGNNDAQDESHTVLPRTPATTKAQKEIKAMPPTSNHAILPEEVLDESIVK
jgi:hypothetical protein